RIAGSVEPERAERRVERVRTRACGTPRRPYTRRNAWIPRQESLRDEYRAQGRRRDRLQPQGGYGHREGADRGRSHLLQGRLRQVPETLQPRAADARAVRRAAPGAGEQLRADLRRAPRVPGALDRAAPRA